MKKEIKATALARALGISRRTVYDWCRRDPNLAYRKNGRDYYIRIEELAKRPGMDIVTALLLEKDGEWIKAVDLAKLAGVPRRTVANWCATRPWFARRIGRNWYLSREVLGATPAQAKFLRKWAPNARNAARIATFASELGMVAHSDE